MAVWGKQPSREYVRTNRIEQRTHAKVLTKGDEDQESCSVVVLKSERSNNGMFSNLRGMPRRVARRHPVAIVEDDCDCESDDDSGRIKVSSFH
jgi:hypothetical protein